MGKLKRILLRYDPPGIGLEVQTPDGAFEIKHQDLPPNEAFLTKALLIPIADRVIAMEAEILTKAKHHDALMTLLAKLYQIDLDANDLDDNIDDDAEAKSPDKSSFPVIHENQQVMLIGMPRPEINGELATVTRAKDDKDKYDVVLNRSDHETIKVKGRGHLVPLAQKNTKVGVGSNVAIRGLRNHLELNGCFAQVVEANDETHKYGVRASESGQLFRVKLENLVAIDPAAIAEMYFAPGVNENRVPNGQHMHMPKILGSQTTSSASIAALGDDGGLWYEIGQLVQVFGLKTASAYNGQCAEVLSIDRVKSRYEIRLQDGSAKICKPENLRLVAKTKCAVLPRGPARAG